MVLLKWVKKKEAAGFNGTLTVDKEQLGGKKLYTDYHPFHIMNPLVDKDLLPILKMPRLDLSERKTISQNRGL